MEYRTAAELALVAALMISIGVNVTDNNGYNPYYCDATKMDMYCFKLSKANDAGVQRYCYYNSQAPTKYKICDTGWNPIEIKEENICPETYGFALTDQGAYYCKDCGPNGCKTCVPSNSVELPISPIDE